MHIVIVNRWPRFQDPSRWDNELTRYEEFFDHQRHRISYVVDGLGAEGVLAPGSTSPIWYRSMTSISTLSCWQAFRKSSIASVPWTN